MKASETMINRNIKQLVCDCSLSLWVSLEGLHKSRDSVLAAIGSTSYFLQLSRSGLAGLELRANATVAETFEGFFGTAEGHAKWIHIMLTIDDFGYTKLYKVCTNVVSLPLINSRCRTLSYLLQSAWLLI